MTTTFEHLEAAALAQFERCKPLARAYLHQRYGGDSADAAVRCPLYVESVKLVELLRPIVAADKIHAMLWPFNGQGEPVPLLEMDPETLAKCQEALLLAALGAMGQTPDEETALNNFFHAMSGE